MKQFGFTLIELMITVTIVGVLAAVMIPNYNGYITESKLKEAHAALMDTRTAFEQSYQDNRAYDCSKITPITTQTFTAPACAVNGTTYTLTTAANISGSVFSFSINEANVRSSSKGSTTQAACWITKVDGTC